MMWLRQGAPSWGILSVKAFLGERRSGKGWSQALSVWVPSTTQPLGIGSQEQEPDNNLLQTCLELISCAPTTLHRSALPRTPQGKGDCKLGDSPAVTHPQKHI